MVLCLACAADLFGLYCLDSLLLFTLWFGVACCCFYLVGCLLLVFMLFGGYSVYASLVAFVFC